MNGMMSMVFGFHRIRKACHAHRNTGAERPDIALAQSQRAQHFHVAAGDDQGGTADRKHNTPPLTACDPLAEHGESDQQDDHRQDRLDKTYLKRGRFLQSEIEHRVKARD